MKPTQPITAESWPTLEQEILRHLENAVATDDGIVSESVPLMGVGDELVRRGFAIQLGDKFRGIGSYRITPSGRAFVQQQVPPAEW